MRSSEEGDAYFGSSGFMEWDYATGFNQAFVKRARRGDASRQSSFVEYVPRGIITSRADEVLRVTLAPPTGMVNERCVGARYTHLARIV